MDTVKAAPVIEPRALAERFSAAARAGGFNVDRFGSVRGYPLFALTKPAPTDGRPSIYLSAGIHGDEPASPLALLRLLEAGTFDARASWYLCPLLNPTGLATGTRENAEGVDLNRDYRHGATPRWPHTSPGCGGSRHSRLPSACTKTGRRKAFISTN